MYIPRMVAFISSFETPGAVQAHSGGFKNITIDGYASRTVEYHVVRTAGGCMRMSREIQYSPYAAKKHHTSTSGLLLFKTSFNANKSR
jgi:hypothetical protein